MPETSKEETQPVVPVVSPEEAPSTPIKQEENKETVFSLFLKKYFVHMAYSVIMILVICVGVGICIIMLSKSETTVVTAPKVENVNLVLIDKVEALLKKVSETEKASQEKIEKLLKNQEALKEKIAVMEKEEKALQEKIVPIVVEKKEVKNPSVVNQVEYHPKGLDKIKILWMHGPDRNMRFPYEVTKDGKELVVNNHLDSPPNFDPEDGHEWVVVKSAQYVPSLWRDTFVKNHRQFPDAVWAIVSTKKIVRAKPVQ